MHLVKEGPGRGQRPDKEEKGRKIKAKDIIDLTKKMLQQETYLCHLDAI